MQRLFRPITIYKVVFCQDLLSNIHLLLKLGNIIFKFTQDKQSNDGQSLDGSGHVGKTKAAEHAAWRGHVIRFLQKSVPRRGNDSKNYRTQVESGNK